MTNFEVRIGDSKNFEDNDLCGNVTYDVQDISVVYCNGELRGRYVSVQTVNDNAQLILCDVKAYYSKLTKKIVCQAFIGLFPVLIKAFYIYRLITAYLLLRVKLDRIMHAR